LIRGWTLVLFGTAIPPYEHDEYHNANRQTTPAAKDNSNAFYRSNPLGGVTTNPYLPSSSVSSNRKQNNNNNKSTTSNPQSTSSSSASTRKNGKQKNGKGNKNNQQQQRGTSTTTTTTVRPNYTNVMLNQLNNSQATIKSKVKSNQNAGSTNLSKATSMIPQQRPRPTAKLPNAKSNPNNYNSNNFLSPKSDKFQPFYYEKSSGKAPKQVKEGSYTTSRSLDGSGGPTPNPSMTKMFERYEKIEQIYPELQPYKDNVHPAYFTVTSNGKPSRENSKSFSSFVSSVDSMPQKKNTDIATIARQKTQSSAATTANKNGKGGPLNSLDA